MSDPYMMIGSDDKWYEGYAVGGPVDGCILRSRSPFYRVIPKVKSWSVPKNTPPTAKTETFEYRFKDGYWRPVK